MMRNTPTEFVYHPIGDDDPNAYGPDDLVHVEVDLEGRSHIWPYTSEMHDRRYHPEWMPGYVESGRSERPK